MGIALLSRRRSRWCRLAVALAAGLAGGPAGAAAGVDTGAPAGAPVVVSVSLRSEAPVAVAEIEPLLAVLPGEPLTEERVRRTLRSVRLSGMAAEVELFVRPVAGGVEVVIVLRPDVIVDAVAIEGETGVDVERLRRRVEQRIASPLREDRLLRGVYALQDALAAQGYRSARVRLAVDVDERSRRARVAYRIDAGPRVAVGEVRFEGLPAEIAPERALAALRARPGEPLREFAVRGDAERLHRFLVEAGYRRASVEPAQESARPDAGVVDLAWRVESGPRVELVLVGADREELEKRGLLPFMGEAGYDEALLVQAVGLIRAHYQGRGHYDVAVRTSEEDTGALLRVRLEIEPGPRWTLEEIDFRGNEAFPDERLARLLQTVPRRLLTPGSGRLVDQVLTEDLSNLRSFYALSGFDRARVGPPEVERDGDRLRLVVPVVEGPKRSVAEVRITGLAALDPERLAAELPIVAGGPYHRLLLESSVDRIRSRLEERGYRSAIVAPAVEWSADDTVASVTFGVLEGERSIAEAVLLRGNTRTDTTILRRFIGLGAGAPISTAGLLDAQRRLYRLGVFSSVDVAVPPAGAAAAAREVLIEVEEGRTRAVAYGAGYDSESGARGVLRLSESNLFGRLITVQLDALVAQRSQVYRALARQPYLFRWPVEARGQFYDEAEDRPDFDVARRGVQIGVERLLGAARFGLFYDYRIVELETDQPVEVIPLESREARVASLIPTVLVDRRDDPVDPVRGWSGSLSYEHAFPAFRADAEFGKLFTQWTAFLPLGRLGVAAMSARGGAIWPRAEAEDPELEPIDAVPSAELFYAGGRTSHRAFPRDRLGIPGETLFVEPGEDPVPLGGGALALVNLEWRFPIVGDFGGNLFVDGGNVWREIADLDPSQARWGAGVGLRYQSPVGPLRVEIGWNLDREPGEDPYVWFVSLGNPF